MDCLAALWYSLICLDDHHMPPGTILEPYFPRHCLPTYIVFLLRIACILLPIMPDDKILKSVHEGAVVVDDDELQLVNACSVDNQGGN